MFDSEPKQTMECLSQPIEEEGHDQTRSDAESEQTMGCLTTWLQPIQEEGQRSWSDVEPVQTMVCLTCYSAT